MPTNQFSNQQNQANLVNLGRLCPTQLLTRDEVANYFGLSKRWLEIAATRGQGPPIVRISPRMVRYRIADILDWIESFVDRGDTRSGGT